MHKEPQHKPFPSLWNETWWWWRRKTNEPLQPAVWWLAWRRRAESKRPVKWTVRTTGIRERTSIVLKPVLVPMGCRAMPPSSGCLYCAWWTNQRNGFPRPTKHARIYPVLSTDPTGIYRGQILSMQGGQWGEGRWVRCCDDAARWS